MNNLYLSPKQIAVELTEQLGRKFSAKYVRAIRIACIAQGGKLFIAGGARVTDVVAWLAANPSFTSNSVYLKKRQRGQSDTFAVSNGNK